MKEAEFEALIKEYCEAKGREYMEEAERLNNDPDFVFPEELDRKCLAAIESHFPPQTQNK